MAQRGKPRRGSARVSPKHHVIPPTDAMAQAGLNVGDRQHFAVTGAGELTPRRQADPIEEHAGALTGVYPAGYIDELRKEWADDSI